MCSLFAFVLCDLKQKPPRSAPLVCVCVRVYGGDGGGGDCRRRRRRPAK